MIGAAVMLAFVFSAKADELCAQPSQIVTSCGNNKPASRPARAITMFMMIDV
jgi:hypothetical protein